MKIEVIRDQEIIGGYLSDASNTKGHAEALVRPRSTQEVSDIMRHCQQNSISITVTAQRTSTTGGPVPYGGWLLSTELINEIHSDTEVDGGVLLGEYQRIIEGRGLLFPPDPTSRNECSIGAAIACNASGARTFRYGAIRPWVVALEVVLPTGDVMVVNRESPIPVDWPTVNWSPPLVKTAAGYEPTNNLLDLMIGQEGTLGIITKAWLKVIKAPEDVIGMIVFFPGLDDCLNFVVKAKKGAQRPDRDAVEGSLNPRAIEFFDQHAMKLIRQRVSSVPDLAQCGLFMEVEDEPNLEDWFEAMQNCNALVDDIILAEDQAGRDQLYAVRHAIPAGVNEIVIANGMPKVGTDFSVPDQYLVPMMESYESVPMDHVLFGHIGDNHLHLNLLPKTVEELAFAKEMYRELALLAVEFGGTVSAEHGIGKIKRELLHEMLGEGVIDSFRRLKRKVDPNWVLGSGILFAE
jgi:D-lactate dehydrogenase (cytochrome)